jgi:hypothetical protein
MKSTFTVGVEIESLTIRRDGVTAENGPDAVSQIVNELKAALDLIGATASVDISRTYFELSGQADE